MWKSAAAKKHAMAKATVVRQLADAKKSTTLKKPATAACCKEMCSSNK